MKNRISKIMLVFSLALTLVLPQLVFAGSSVVVEKPTAMAMAGDAVIARPFLLAITVIGSGLFVATLPFSLLGGNVGEAANVLILAPAESTFVRCLGCKNPGYKRTVEKIEGSEE